MGSALQQNRSRMRVLCVLHFFPPGGEEGCGRLHDFVSALVRRGHLVTVVTGRTSYQTGKPFARFRGRLLIRELEAEGCQTIRVWTLPGYHHGVATRAAGLLLFMLSALCIALLIPRPHLVFASSPPPTVGLVAAVVARLRRAKFLFEVRDTWIDDAESLGLVRPGPILSIARGFERWIERTADSIIAVTPGIRDKLLRIGTAPSRVTMIPNGVDTITFQGGPVDPSVRPAYGIPPQAFLVVCAGALGLNNHPDTLVEAATLLQENSAIRLLVVGDGSARAKAEHRARKLRLPNIRFVGWLPRRQIPAILRTADAAICIAKDNELNKIAYANRAFEAMAMGKPLLCAIDGLLRDLVESAAAGLYAAPGSGAALAGAISALACMPEAARRAMGDRGRQLVIHEFPRQKMIDRMLDQAEGIVLTGALLTAPGRCLAK